MFLCNSFLSLVFFPTLHYITTLFSNPAPLSHLHGHSSLRAFSYSCAAAYKVTRFQLLLSFSLHDALEIGRGIWVCCKLATETCWGQ